MVAHRRIGPESAFIREFTDVRKRVGHLETRPSGNIVVRETLKATDPATGVSTQLGKLPDGSIGFQPFIGDITPPPVATVPIVSAQPGTITVSWDGLFVANAEKPRDFEHVNVFGHKMSGTTTLLSLVVGVLRLDSESVLVTQEIAAAGETWEFSLESEDFNGNRAVRGARSASIVMQAISSDQSVTDALAAVQADADAAAASAQSAQGAANTAQSAADAAAATANSKGKTIIQSAAPAVADQLAQNLWIDTTNGANTPKRWNGTIWETVTDKVAIDAANAAVAAQTKADQAFNNAATAATAAGDAQSTADGKNTSWYLDDAPAGTSHKIGDLWFDTNDNYKIRTWTGTIWQTTQDSWTAQITAESKGTVYTQAVTPPVEARLPQNLWVDTSLGLTNTITKYWDGNAWAALADKAATDAANLAGTKSKVIYSNTAPTGVDANVLTLWIDTTGGANTPKKWVSGTTWTAVTDKVATDAATAAANAMAAQSYTTNASFDDWSSTYPTGFVLYGTIAPVKETTIIRRAPFSARFNIADTTVQGGLAFSTPLSHAPNLEYYTIEMEFYLVSGGLAGAGMILDWNGMTNNRATVNLASEITTPIIGKWYRVTKTLRRPTNATGTWTSMGGYVMGQWSPLGGSAKNIIFDWLNIRPSSVEEILAYTAPTTQYVDQAEADAILAASNDATSKANTAQANAIADTTTRLAGKNKVVWSLSAASGTTGYIAGDTWYQRDGTGAVIAQWEFTTSWQARTVSDAVMGNITAAKITYGTMSGERIDANTISAKHLFVGDFTNLVDDPSFEIPFADTNSSWTNGNSFATIDTVQKRSGAASLKGTGTGGGYFSVTSKRSMKVTSGDKISLSYWYRAEAGTTIANGPRIAWGGGNATSWTANIGSIVTDGTWNQKTHTIDVPAGATTGLLRFDVSVPTGILWIDDVAVRHMTGGQLIVDGAIDGKTITGPTIQTESTASRGIKLTGTELAGYDAAGVKNFSLTSEGTLTLKGAIQSGSTIEGALVTGTSGVQTSTAATAGVKMNNTGIKAYDGANNLTFHLDATTGMLEVPGIKANSIGGDKLVVGSVTAEKIRVGDFSNFVVNGFGDLGAGIGLGTGLIYETTDKPSSITGVFKSTAGQGTYTGGTAFFDVNPSTEYITEVWLKASLPNSRIYIELRNQDSVLGTTNIDTGTGVSQGSYVLSNLIVPTVWTKYTVKSTTLSTSTKLRVGSIYFNHTNGSERTAVVSVAIGVRRRLAGSLLVDGAITTNHMVSGTIDAAVLTAQSIKAAQIAAKTITVDKLVISSTDNLIVESDFGNGGSSWELKPNITINATAGRGSLPAMRITGATGSNTSLNLVNKIPVGAEDRFRASMWITSSSAAASGKFNIKARAYTTATAYTNITLSSNSAMASATWTNVSGISPVLPAGTVALEFYVESINDTTGQIVDIDYVAVTRAADGKLVVDGAIDGKTITGATIIGGELKTTAVTGDVTARMGPQTVWDPTGGTIRAGIGFSKVGSNDSYPTGLYSTDGYTLQISQSDSGGAGGARMTLGGGASGADQKATVYGWGGVDITGRSGITLDPQVGEVTVNGTLNVTTRLNQPIRHFTSQRNLAYPASGVAWGPGTYVRDATKSVGDTFISFPVADKFKILETGVYIISLTLFNMSTVATNSRVLIQNEARTVTHAGQAKAEGGVWEFNIALPNVYAVANESFSVIFMQDSGSTMQFDSYLRVTKIQ